MLNRENEPLLIYTIYERPNDYPNHYVVKRWIINGKAEPYQDSSFFVQEKELDACRKRMLQLNLYNIGRQLGDHKVILENWV